MFNLKKYYLIIFQIIYLKFVICLVLSIIFRLKKLPRTFSQFTSLVKLNVTYNQLKKLPKNLHKCTKLEIFYAEHNFIKFLPKNLGFLPSAVFVNLSDNKLL